MKKYLLIALAILCLAGCSKSNEGEKKDALVGTQWSFGRGSDAQIILSFYENNRVSVKEVDNNMNIRFDRYFEGSYSLDTDGTILFQLHFQDAVGGMRYTKGVVKNDIMNVYYYMTLNGKDLSIEQMDIYKKK